MRPILRRAAVALLAIGMAAACSPKSSGSADVQTAPEIVLGNENAKVTVIEWASLTCPHCARWNEDVFPAFKKKYIDSGQVKYVFREFLTPPEQVAAAGFLLARCAGRDKYFNVTDAVFHSQNEMFTTGDVRGVLFRIGRSVGMSDEQTQACVQDEKSLAALNQRLDKAIKTDKVASTPSFDINGVRLEGEQPLAKFDEVIAAAMKK